MNIVVLAQQFLDIVLPRRERTVRADAYMLADLAVTPRVHNACGIRIATLMYYKNRAVEDCIRALKYDGSASAALLLAAALADYLREEIASVQLFSQRPVLIAPVPLHKSRVHERGFNQIELVLEKLPEEFRIGTLSTLTNKMLARTRHTKPQTKLPRQERLTNAVGAFAADDAIVRNAHVFLIDDVTTTGATLAEATKTLEKAGATVSALALARA